MQPGSGVTLTAWQDSTSAKSGNQPYTIDSILKYGPKLLLTCIACKMRNTFECAKTRRSRSDQTTLHDFNGRMLAMLSAARDYKSSQKLPRHLSLRLQISSCRSHVATNNTLYEPQEIKDRAACLHLHQHVNNQKCS